MTKSFDLKITRKNVKNINLRVKTDGSVSLSVPLNAKDEYVEDFISKKTSWIKKHLEYFKNNYAPESEKRYINGEEFSYLGHKYELKVIKSEEDSLDFDGEFITIYTKFPLDLEHKKKLLNKWYNSKAQAQFTEIINYYLPILDKSIEKLSIKTMKSRWGSCNFRKRNITLNLKLIEKPKICIEYVVLHELAHLTHPNHSKDFYNYVLNYMPDYKRRKDILEGKVKI